MEAKGYRRLLRKMLMCCILLFPNMLNYAWLLFHILHNRVLVFEIATLVRTNHLRICKLCKVQLACPCVLTQETVPPTLSELKPIKSSSLKAKGTLE